MMGFRLPYVRNVSSPTKRYIVNFGGLNLTDNYKEGELSESENMTSERSPTLSSVKPYYSGYIEHGEATYKVGSVWGDGETLALFLQKRTGVGDKVVFKAYSKDFSPLWDTDVVWKMYDEALDKWYTDIVKLGGYTVIFAHTDAGNENGNVSPIYFNEGAENQTGWVSSGCTVVGMAIFSGDKLGLSNLNVLGGDKGQVDFRVGDSLTISDCRTAPENCMTLQVSSVEYVDGGLELVFDGASFTECVEDGVGVARRVPENPLYPIAINNRIWLTSGLNICACALGDPSNWEKYEGLASDSYRVAVDSPLDFTGMSEFSSNPIIFKEDIIYRIYGTMPSNYSLQKIDAPGVMKGCARSIQKINEVLYYKGRSGVYRYAGGVPQCISTELGDMSEYKYAVAGADDRYYYLTMQKGSSSKRITFVYDTLTGIWQKETALNIVSYAQWGGVLYSFESDSGNVYSKQKDGSNGLTTDETRQSEWSVTFKPFTETIENRKVYSKLSLRLELEEGAWCSVSVQHDNKLFEEVKTVKGEEDLSTVIVPIRLRPCDKFTIRLEGRGYCCLHTLVREYRTGGDR